LLRVEERKGGFALARLRLTPQRQQERPANESCRCWVSLPPEPGRECLALLLGKWTIHQDQCLRREGADSATRTPRQRIRLVECLQQRQPNVPVAEQIQTPP